MLVLSDSIRIRVSILDPKLWCVDGQIFLSKFEASELCDLCLPQLRGANPDHGRVEDQNPGSV